MALVSDDVELLRLMQQPSPELPFETVSACRKASLLAIGAHIDAGLPGWMRSYPLPKEMLWQHVAESTLHKMTGQQLQRLYLALKAQDSAARHRSMPYAGKMPQLELNEAQIKARMAAARSIALQERDEALEQAPADFQAMHLACKGECFIVSREHWPRLPWDHKVA
jgi:hypothetical protein